MIIVNTMLWIWLLVLIVYLLKLLKKPKNSSVNRQHITKRSRGTANAWHFYYALVFVITVLCGSLAVALAAP